MFRKLSNIASGNTARWNKLRSESVLLPIQRQVHSGMYPPRQSMFFPILWGAVSLMEDLLSPHRSSRIFSVSIKSITQLQMNELYLLLIEHMLIIYKKEKDNNTKFDYNYLMACERAGIARTMDNPVYEELLESEFDLKKHAVHINDEAKRILRIAPTIPDMDWYVLSPCILSAYEVVLQLQQRGTTTSVIDESLL